MKATIETERLLLRPFELSDDVAMFEGWASDPEVTKYLTWSPHTCVEGTHALLQIWVKQYEKPERINFAIVEKASNKLIGGIDVVGYLEGTPVIGYVLGRAYWGKGYMTEACKRVLEFLFDKGYEEVRIDAQKENIASQRVILKCGGVFLKEEYEDVPAKGERVIVYRYLIKNPKITLKSRIIDAK